MKPRLALALLFLVTLALALYWFGVFSPATSLVPETPAVPPPALPPAGLTTPEVQEPKDEPQPEYPAFPAPVRVMILAKENRSFNAWMMQLFEFGLRVKFQAWYSVPADEKVVTHSDTLPALAAPPTSSDLDGVHVLIVSAFDPSLLPSDFWASVADRVRGGSLGLLLVPDFANGQAMAEIPALKALTPIAKARAVAPIVVGGPVAGVFSTPRALVLAPNAAEHPATRIVAWKGWNEKWWDSLGRGEKATPWATKFCSPVEALAPGAIVLARLAAGIDAAPALVTMPGDARILWAGGFFDLETEAYKDPRSVLAFRVLLHNWMLWLAPPKA